MLNKNYLVTGAGSDIGGALIEKLRGNKENKILAVSRSHKSVTPLPTETCRFLTGIDLTKETDLERLANELEAFFNGGFTLVHSVGSFWLHKPIVSTGLIEAREMMESHYITLYAMLKIIIPVFKKYKQGKIIAFSCTSVGYSYPEMAAFTSVKAAIEALIKCVANENSRYGVVANCIALSTIRTEKVERSKSSKYHKDYVSVDELLEIIEELAGMSPLVNGNVIKLLKYSDCFYNESYFMRNPSPASV